MSTTVVDLAINSTFQLQQCTAASKWTFVPLMPLPIISGCLNIFVWLAATVYRERLLRQNYVYSCVTSTLLSNVIFLSLHLWDLFSSYLNPLELTVNPPGLKMQLLWTVCQAGATSMLFVMCWNLSALIYVMLDSTYFQSAAKQVHGGIGNESNETSKILRAKRAKALLLIAFSWLLPFILTIFAVVFWNCAATCRCGVGSVGDICPRDKGCSRVWNPLTNGFMGLNIGFWFAEVFALISFTFSGMRNFTKFMSRSKRPVSVPGDPRNDDVDRASIEEAQNTNGIGVDTNDVTPKSDMTSSVNDHYVIKRPSAFKMWLSSNPRLRLAAILSAVFVTCTTPVAVTFFVDLFADNYNITAARISTMFIVHVYTLLCPILLVKYMTNLRTALIQFISDILFCFK